MRRKVVMVVLICIFLFVGCTGIGCAIYRGKIGTDRAVNAGIQKVVLATEQGERGGM